MRYKIHASVSHIFCGTKICKIQLSIILAFWYSLGTNLWRINSVVLKKEDDTWNNGSTKWERKQHQAEVAVCWEWKGAGLQQHWYYDQRWLKSFGLCLSVFTSILRIRKGCCSVALLCPTLCNPMECITAGFPVLHRLLELAQTHVRWVGDAIQLSHLLSSLLLPLSIFPSIMVFSNESALCIRWPKFRASASALVLPMNIQEWFPLGLTGLMFLQSKGLSRVFSNTMVQKHQLFRAQPSLWFKFHIHTWLLEKL